MIETPRASRAAVWLSLAAPVLFAPFLLFPSARTMWVLAAVPLAAAVAKWHSGYVVPPSPLNLPVSLLLVAVFVSAWVTPSFVQSMPKLAGVALGAIVFAAVLRASEDRRALTVVVAGFCAAVVAVGLLSLVGTDWRTKIEALRPLVELFPVRWKGLPGAEEGFNMNPVGVTMALGLPLLASLAQLLWRDRSAIPSRWRKPLLAATLGAVLVVAFVLVLTQSRGAWLGFACGGALVLLGGPGRARRARVLGVLIVPIVVLLILQIFATTGGSLLERAQMSEAGELTLHGRRELWSRALMAIGDLPLTGMGLNVFRDVIHRVYPPFGELPTAVLPHAHNGVLQTTVDLGTPGLIAYVAIAAAALVAMMRVWRDTTDGLRRAIARGLMAGVVALVVWEITDVMPLGAKVGGLWWVMLGLAAATFRAEKLKTLPHSARLGVLWVAASAATAIIASYLPVAGVAAGAGCGVALGWACARG